ERAQDPGGSLMLQRQREAALARIGCVPEEPALASAEVAVARRELPSRVAARRLDLDHLDAEVDQQTAAEVAERVRQIEGAEPLQRRRHRRRASSTAPRTLTEPEGDRRGDPPPGARVPAADARLRRCRAACIPRRGSPTAARPLPRKARRHTRARAWRSRNRARR